VHLPRQETIAAIGRDEGGECNGRGVGKELGNLCRTRNVNWEKNFLSLSFFSFSFLFIMRGLGDPITGLNGMVASYLAYSPDILISISLREAEVFVQSKANVVAIKTICGEPKVEEVLL
jgi:hypothetical protein